jgi:hypothetical protein
MLWRMLLLIAVLLMPFGMAPAAAAGPSHRAGAAMPMQHCPEQAPNHRGRAGSGECTMACSAALPAGDVKPAEPLQIVGACDRADVMNQLHGLHPETATPPPRHS